MDYLKAILLALLQGLTEFLPVSSSGHLIMFENLGLKLSDNDLFFNLMLHLGTLLSVIVVYRKRIINLFRVKENKDLLYLLIATLPAAVFAVLVRYIFPESLLDGTYLPMCFMGTSVLLFSSETIKPKGVELSKGRAFFAGLLEGIAVMPGVSRSGSTISALRYTGLTKEESADFSFLMALPIILGATIVEGTDLMVSKVEINWGPTLIGTLVAFITGIIAIKFLVSFIKKHSLVPFGVYTGILAIVLLFV